jgi:hypothetical protein
MVPVQIQNGRLFSGMPISPQQQVDFILQGGVFIREEAFHFV